MSGDDHVAEPASGRRLVARVPDLGGAMVTKVPPPSQARDVAQFAGAMSCVGLVAVVGGPFIPSLMVTVLGAALCLAMPPLEYRFWRTVLLPPVVSRTKLAFPKLWHGWQIVELRDVEGIGLRYTSLARANGWRLKVWISGADTPLVVAGPYSFPSGAAGSRRPLSGHVPPLDAVFLADSEPGRAATLIAGLIHQVQGPNGALEARHREVSAPNDGGFETAYWSPDGRVGSLLDHR